MIIIDTNIWISAMDIGCPNHKKALNLIKDLCYEDIYINDQLFAEILTVIRNKISDKKCKDFLNFLKDTDIQIFLSENKILESATIIFFNNCKLSFLDSILLAASKIKKIPLVSFDKELIKAIQKLQ